MERGRHRRDHGGLRVIPDDVVERVREEADIVSIVGEFVKLKRVGNSFRGPCPFHHGKDPNFSVTAGGGYKCFSCGDSGDVFTFVMKHLGLDFAESVRWVGEKAGVEVREVARKTDERDLREPLWEVNATAADFFRAQLWDTAKPEKVARDYLASRHISRDDADRFGLGYAPKDVALMRTALTALGFDDARLLAAGLVVAVQRGASGAARPRSRSLDVSHLRYRRSCRLALAARRHWRGQAQIPQFRRNQDVFESESSSMA